MTLCRFCFCTASPLRHLPQGHVDHAGKTKTNQHKVDPFLFGAGSRGRTRPNARGALRSLLACLTRAFRKRKRTLRCGSPIDHADKTKTNQHKVDPFLFGAGSRGRTDTVSLPPDFESGTSANSIIPAYDADLLYHIDFQKSRGFFEKGKRISKKAKEFLRKGLANRQKVWYTVCNKIYLIKSNVVTGTMMLQQPASL